MEGEEIWVTIKRSEGTLEISNEGRVRYNKTKAPLKLHLNKAGYWRFNQRLHGKTINYVLHRELMRAFVGERPEGKQVNHKNGIKTDNKLENLEYVTSSENVKHAFRMGLKSLKGEKNNNSEITKQQVIEIIEYEQKTNFGAHKIARDLDLPYGAVNMILVGATWNHLDEVRKWNETRCRESKNLQGRFIKIDKKEILEVIRIREETSMSARKIAKKLGLSFYSVDNLLRGRSWNWLPEVKQWNIERGIT